MCSNAFRGQVEGLEIERDRLENTISHLLKTNRELEEYLRTEGHDKELRDAIGENIVTIAKFKGQLERLDQEIRKARGEVVDVTLSQTSAVPVREPAPSTTVSPSSYTSDTVHTVEGQASNVVDDALWMAISLSRPVPREMDSSKYERFRKDVRDLNAQFEEWIRQKLRTNKSASLSQGIAEYNEKLQELELETGFSADMIEASQLGACLHQLTPQSVTKVVHFVRHGHGFHNPPMFRDHHDARLTTVGWKQAFEVRKHILQLKLPFVVEIVVTSPLSRCLETAAGIFGYEKKNEDSEILKRERNSSSECEGPSHPKLYKSKNLPIVAQELCRECLLGCLSLSSMDCEMSPGVGNKCDRRRKRQDLAAEFPGVDFSKVEYDEDLLGQTVSKEWGDQARKRAQSFVKWLMNRPQSHIAVISHCSFLAFVMQECCTHLKGNVAAKTTEMFRNCELRTLVLSRVDTSDVKSVPNGTWFRPGDI